MTVRFYLRDLMIGTLAICAMLGAFCLTPRGFWQVSVVLLPAAVSANFVKSDWLSCVLAGGVGALAMYLSFALIAVSPTVDLGSFPGVTLAVGEFRHPDFPL